MRGTVTIFMPDHRNETFEAGKGDVKDIHIIYGNPPLLQVRFTDGRKISFANLPFKYTEWEDVCTDTLYPDIPFRRKTMSSVGKIYRAITDAMAEISPVAKNKENTRATVHVPRKCYE